MPEADRYLAKAHESLGEARQIIQIGLAAAAARSAYYAAFHAAEAYIFAKTGRVGKRMQACERNLSVLQGMKPKSAAP